MPLEETIIARSDPPGGALRGIIRLSGPKAVDSLLDLFQPAFESDGSLHAVEGVVFPWGASRPVPARILYWPEGRGYTGQETVEIHTLGSPPILEAVIAALCRTGKVRLAAPGEFTMRAFLAGRLDLPQVEAVLAVIEAADTATLTVALNQLAGGISEPLARIRESLLDTLARLEAGLDFVDEDIEFISMREVRRILDAAREEAACLLASMEKRKLSNEKPRVVLVGPPNVGKSSLFNALLESQTAIVSPRPGTTRDYIEAEFDDVAVPFTLVDTAGTDENRPALTPLDEKAQDATRHSFERADLVLNCRDREQDISPGTSPGTINIRTKADDEAPHYICCDYISVSSKTGFGIRLLRSEIVRRLSGSTRKAPAILDTSLRCRESLRRVLDSLDLALELLNGTLEFFDESFLAAELNTALACLGEIDGSTHSADLLDRIFGRFCIGK